MNNTKSVPEYLPGKNKTTGTLSNFWCKLFKTLCDLSIGYALPTPVKKTTQLFVKKLIVGLCIFLIPTIVNSIISFAQSDKDKTAGVGDFRKCALCFAGDDACDYYIKNSGK